MPCKAGITTRPDERKKEWRIKYPTMRGWTVVDPYPNRKAAQDWENRQTMCERHGGGDEPDLPGAQWYGYRFDY